MQLTSEELQSNRKTKRILNGLKLSGKGIKDIS